MDWQTIGAISGVLSFLLTLAVESRRLKQMGWQQLVVATLIGIVALLVVTQASNILTTTPVQQATQQTLHSYETISLRQLGLPEESNLGLNAGTNNLLDISFETGWTVSTQCADRSSQPATIQLDGIFSQPINLYLLLQAGWATQQFNGKELGAVSLIFSDGEHIEVPLIVGFNIRDWSRNNPEAVSTATSSTLREAWRGITPDGTIGGIDILTIEVPNEYRRLALTSIQVADTSRVTVGSQDPCIHLLAITVEHLR